VIQPEIPLGARAGSGNQVGRLTQVLALTDQLEGAQRLGHGELRLRQWLGGGLGIATEIERFDGNDVSLHRECPEQHLGEPARLLCVGVGPPVLGHVACDAGQGLAGAFHDLIDIRRRGKEPGKVTHSQLDTIQNLGQRRQVAQLGQAPERLHPSDDVV
jgi:hypothetical protein